MNPMSRDELLAKIAALASENVDLQDRCRARDEELKVLRADAEIAVRVCDLVLQRRGIEFGEYTVERLGEFARRAFDELLQGET